MIFILTITILAIIIIVIYFAFRPKKEDEEEIKPDEKVNMENVRTHFKFISEIETIFNVVEAYLETYKNTLKQYPLLVNPYVFMLTVRLIENGKTGTEFGVLHPDAINTDLKNQAEWTMSTLIKDTKRWYLDELVEVDGRKKKDFKDFVEYFGTKWAKIGAPNDPNNLNKNWLPNFRDTYPLYLP